MPVESTKTPLESLGDPPLTPTQLAQRELAQRALARRRLLQFILRFNPRYLPGWVHEDICFHLEQFSRDVAEGKSPRLGLFMPPRHGKQISDDTPVPTPRGWTTHGALRPGDEVFGPDGMPAKVIAVSAPTASDVRVELTNGEVFYTHEAHEWTLYDRGAATWRTEETGWLMRSNRGTRRLISSGRAVYQLPAAAALQFAGATPALHPYVLGAWLGDGSCGVACITHGTAKQPVVDKITALGYPVSSVSQHKTTGVLTTRFSGPRPGEAGRMTRELQAIGVYRVKRIPPAYQLASVDARLELVAGLVDTDGSVCPKTSRVTISTTRPDLAGDIVELLTGLGLRPYKTVARPVLSSSGIQGRDPVITIGFQPTSPLPTVVAHKQVTRIAPQRREGFASVTHDPQGKTGRCIQVDRADGLYVVGRKMTVTHNSEIVSRNFPAWHLGQYPHHELIACSYNLDLAITFSRKVKQVIEDPQFAPLFPDLQTDPTNWSASEWMLLNGGGYLAAGVGGGITGRGAHCFPAGTLVHTETGPVDIADLVHLLDSVRVWSYNPSTSQAELRHVEAFSAQNSADLYEVRTCSGRVIRATGNHPFYTAESGYKPARDLAVGDTLYVYAPESTGQHAVQIVLPGAAKSAGDADLPLVLRDIPAAAVRGREGSAARDDGFVLQRSVFGGAPRGEKSAEVRGVPGADTIQPAKILQPGMQGIVEKARAAAHVVSGVFRALSAAAQDLLAGLRKQTTQHSAARGGQRELPARAGVPGAVRQDAPTDTDAGQESLCGVQREGGTGASLRREQAQQRAGKSGLAVQEVSPGAPQVGRDTVSVVTRISSGPVRVYDIQVEENHCFFANDVLVHNCLLIDDPVKSAEEADSQLVLEKIWEWYGATAYTRLAPGGGVLLIQTCWSDLDLAGRIQQAMKDDPEFDRFTIIKYPAIAEEYEYRNATTREIVRSPQPLTISEIITQDLELLREPGQALHAERYDEKKLAAIKRTLPQRFWNALYQQNPVPDDGAYFKGEWFRYYETPPLSECNVFQAWDFAISEKNSNDYTVGSCSLQDYDDTLHFADLQRFRSGDAFQIVEAMLTMAKRWYNPSLIIGVEDGQIWRAIAALLHKRMRELKFYPTVQVLKPIQDKQARGRVLQGRMQQGKVAFPSPDKAPWVDTLRHEFLRFPAGVNDDIVDSCAWNAQLAVGTTPPRRPEPKKLKSWKDRIGGRDGSSNSHMVA